MAKLNYDNERAAGIKNLATRYGISDAIAAARFDALMQPRCNPAGLFAAWDDEQAGKAPARASAPSDPRLAAIAPSVTARVTRFDPEAQTLTFGEPVRVAVPADESGILRVAPQGATHDAHALAARMGVEPAQSGSKLEGTVFSFGAESPDPALAERRARLARWGAAASDEIAPALAVQS